MNKVVAILGIGRISQILFLFLSYKLMTHFLEKDEVGFYFLLIAISSYFSLLVVNPIGVYINRFIHSWKEDGSLFTKMWLFNIFLISLALLSVPISAGLFNFFDVEKLSLLFFVFSIGFYIFSSSLNNTIIPNLNILKYRVSFVSFTFATQLLGIVLSTVFMIYYNKTAAYWLLGQSISFTVFGLISFLYLFKKLNLQKIAPDFKKYKLFKNKNILYKFCIPIAITNICLSFLTQFYRPFSEKVIGLEYLGLIGLGFGIASSISVSFEYLFQQIFYPKFYQDSSLGDKGGREKSWNSIANIGIPAFIILPIFISFLAPFIIQIMSNSSYEGAIYFLMIGAWIEFFRMLSNIFNLITHSELETKKSIKPYVLASITTVLLCGIVLTLKPIDKLIPFIFLVGNLVALVSIYFALKNTIKIKLNYRKIFKAILLSLPLGISPLLYHYAESIQPTIIIFSIFSLYFVLAQFLLIKNEIKEGFE